MKSDAKRGLHNSLAVALFSLVCLAPIHAEITVSNVVTVQPTSNFNTTVYNAGTADKLVVVVAGEHNFGGNTGGQINTVTYGGVALTRLVDRNPIDSTNITAADIWYLDNPAASGTMGATVGGNGNNYAWIILSLTGTADGAGATAISAPDSKTVNLSATGSSSYIIAAHALGGNGNTGSTNGITAISPATILGARVAGNNWTGLVVSGTSGVGAGTATYGFTGGATGGNVTIAAEFLADVPAVATPFNLTITPNATAGLYDFQWDSQEGKVYDLLTSTDLSTPISSWPIYEAGPTLYENLPATGTRTTLMGVPSGAARRFFAMREEAAPPLLSVNFDDGDGGFTVTKVAGTDWAWGDPDSSGFGGQSVTTGNGGAGKCWGTNIGNPGSYVDPTTDSRLKSPRINLTSVASAELSFAQATDFPAGDTAVVRIINDDTNLEIVSGAFPLTVTDTVNTTALWTTVGPVSLPVGAPIRIEWCFTGTGDATDDYMGWYVDDVVIVEVSP